jgi:hypothetical protein
MKLFKGYWYYYLFAFVSVYGLSACNGCNKGKQSPQLESKEISEPSYRDTVKQWTEQWMIRWTGWLDSNMVHRFVFDSLDIAGIDTVTEEVTTIMTEDQFRDFGAYFIYSPDSSQAIDLLSYGSFLKENENGDIVLESAEPDTEVALINVKTQKRKRILFTGPSTLIKVATWLDNNTVLIGGGMYNENNELVPLLWKYDAVHNTIESWQ